SSDLDVTVRPSHVATSTIQELLCGPLWAAPPPPSSPLPPPEKTKIVTEPAETAPEPSTETETTMQAAAEIEQTAAADAGGPRVDSASVAATAKRLTMAFQAELPPASLSPAAFRVTTFDEQDGWSGVEVRGVAQKGGH